ncbi:MAG: SH3 domain-containing protein [Pseudomonadota bacterium]
MIRTTFGLLLLATSALAADLDSPALFAVTNVETGDVLNIRAAPDASSQILDGLQPGATVEVTAMGAEGRWGRVNTDETSGWASLKYLERLPGAETGLGYPVTECFGTEPFWSLDLASDVPVFQILGEDEVTLTVRREVRGQGRPDRQAIIFDLTEGTGVLVVATRTCSDGMSDRAYGLGGDLVLGGPSARMLSGCCSISP